MFARAGKVMITLSYGSNYKDPTAIREEFACFFKQRYSSAMFAPRYYRFTDIFHVDKLANNDRGTSGIMPLGMSASNYRIFSWLGSCVYCFAGVIFVCGLLASGTLAQSTDQPLNVPVYPRFDAKTQPVDIEGLRDSYIVLEDGAVLSLADWVLGSLDKSDIGVGMSDYQNRLFLGQVARAAVGMKQDLVYRSFEDAGPLRAYVPHTPPKSLQVVQHYLSMYIPALAPNWSPVTTGKPTLTDDFDLGRSSSIHFDGQFAESLNQTRERFTYPARLATMLEEFKQN